MIIKLLEYFLVSFLTVFAFILLSFMVVPVVFVWNLISLLFRKDVD